VISCRTVGTSNASPRRKGELWSKMSLSSSKRPYPSDVPSDRKHETVCRAALMLPHCGTVTSPHVGGSFSHESYESQPRKTTSTSTENQKPKTKNQKPKTKNQILSTIHCSLSKFNPAIMIIATRLARLLISACLVVSLLPLCPSVSSRTRTSGSILRPNELHYAIKAFALFLQEHLTIFNTPPPSASTYRVRPVTYFFRINHAVLQAAKYQERD
jgi:hypothetical protein